MLNDEKKPVAPVLDGDQKPLSGEEVGNLLKNGGTIMVKDRNGVPQKVVIPGLN